MDIWETLQPDQPNFSTYYRGTKRIDYALTKIQATHYIQNIRYEQYQLQMTGDHQGLIFDIDPKFLFGPDSEAYPSMQKRGIISKDRKAVTKYLYAFQDHMKAHNVFERLTSLIQEGKPNHNLAENLNRELIRASQHAENQCRRRPLTYWSIDLHQHKEKLSVFGQL